MTLCHGTYLHVLFPLENRLRLATYTRTNVASGS